MDHPASSLKWRRFFKGFSVQGVANFPTSYLLKQPVVLHVSPMETNNYLK